MNRTAKGWNDAEDAAIDEIVASLSETPFANAEDRHELIDEMCATKARALYRAHYDDWSKYAEANTAATMAERVDDELPPFEEIDDNDEGEDDAPAPVTSPYASGKAPGPNPK